MPDVRDVSEKLGVRFVLEGSVRKMGDRLRINAQLIDATDGGHVWAERYDGAMSEIFDFQDRITNEILSALEIKLSSPAGAEKRRTHSVEAYDIYLNGRRHYYQYTPESFADAFRCFEKSNSIRLLPTHTATPIDPAFADALPVRLSCRHVRFALVEHR